MIVSFCRPKGFSLSPSCTRKCTQMLTDRQIKSALKTDRDELILNDGASGKGTGSLRLKIRRTKTGVTATWFGFWITDGQRKTKPLGRYPDLSLVDARQRFAESVRSALIEGKNPHAAIAKSDGATVEQLFREYIDAMKADGKSSWIDVEWSLLTGSGAAAVHFGRNRLASRIEPEDVSEYLAATYQRGKRVSADRRRAHLSAAFNWGMKAAFDYRVENRRDWGIKFNPVSSVKRDTEAAKPRDRVLTRNELRALWHGLDQGGFEPQTRAAIRLLICCGQRVRETLRLEPGEIVDGIWLMPQEKTKCQLRPHAIPLPDLALPVLEGFEGFSILDSSVRRALKRWGVSNGIQHFQTRDLRRTWKTLTADAGIDRFTRDLIQQHASGDTGSKHYDRAAYMNEKREAMRRWNDYLVSVIECANG